MNLQKDKPTIYEDEISLYDLWKNVIKRKKLIFWIFIITVASAGAISFMMPKIYRGEVDVRIQPKEIISSKELSEILGKFDNEKIGLIFSRFSDSIKGVMVTQISGSADKMKLVVELSQPSQFQDVIKTIVKYLNDIPLITRAVELSREQLIKRLEEIDVVMAKSQEDAERFQKMMVKEKLNPIGFNPIQFNRMLSDLEVEKIGLQQNIKTLAGVEIITEPTIYPKPVKPRPKLYITLAGVISLFFGVFLAMLLFYLERFKR